MSRWHFPMVLQRLSAVWTLALVGSVAQAQLLPAYDDVRLRQMDYENSGGERGLTVFHYGRDGVLRSARWMLADRSRHSVNYHLYDALGREVEKVREFSDGLTSTERYEYDEAGRRTREELWRSDGARGEIDFRWDRPGRLAAADCSNYKGWLTGRIDYEHEEGRVAAGRISRDGRNIGAITYGYDGAGRLATESWDFGGQWSQTFTYAYESVPTPVFAAANPLIEMNPRYRVVAETYDFNGEGGGPSTYSYDDVGRLTEKVFRRSDGLQTTTTYRYDEAGSLVRSHRAYLSGETADFHYRYDDALRLTEKTFVRSDGAAGYERYAYDRLGRLATAEYGNVDFWLRGTLRFSFDSRGHLAAASFANEEGPDAEIDFVTDDSGNVLRVHWVFESGMTQTYEFRYEPIAPDPSAGVGLSAYLKAVGPQAER